MKISKDFFLGFISTVVAGCITMYIYSNFMQEKTIEKSIMEFQRRMDIPTTQSLLELSKLYNI